MPITSGSVPKHATYVQGGLPVGLDSRRRNVRLTPQAGSGPYNDQSSNIIRIDLPPSIGFLDTQSSYLRFRVNVENNDVDLDAGPCRMDNNCMSWCHRFEIISNNGSVLESIENYNLLANLLHSATSPSDYRNTAGKLLDNQGSKAERTANMASPDGKMYCTGLDCSGILGGNSKYLPCQFIQGSLTMEFNLAPFNECFTHSGSGRGKYSISDVEFVAECLQFGQDFNMVFEQQLRTAGVDIAYHTYRAHTQSLIQSDNQNIQISQNSKSVKGCYCVMRDANKCRSSKYDSLSTYKSGNLMDYQFDLGGRLFPEGRLQVEGSKYSNAYASNLNSFNHFRDHGGGSDIDRSTFNAAQNSSLFSRDGTGTSSYKANSTKRMYGKVASGVLYSPTVGPDAAVNASDRALYAFGTIFRPDDIDDIGSFKLGERYKLSTKNNIADGGVATAASQTIHAVADSAYHRATEVAKGTTSDLHQDEYLYVVGFGDVVVPHQVGNGSDILTVGYISITGCVHFASKSKDNDGADGVNVKKGGPIHPLPYAGIVNNAAGVNTNIGNTTKTFGGGSLVEGKKADHAKYLASTAYDSTDPGTQLTIANEVVVVDQQLDISAGTKARFVFHSCVMDQIPDDSKFYIGMSFETHDEHESMVSGTDLTNTVPLHLNLKFDTGTFLQEKVASGDVITSFVHYDCILRIEPDGNCISSA